MTEALEDPIIRYVLSMFFSLPQDRPDMFRGVVLNFYDTAAQCCEAFNVLSKGDARTGNVYPCVDADLSTAHLTPNRVIHCK